MLTGTSSFFPAEGRDPYRGTWTRTGDKVHFQVLDGEMKFNGVFQTYDTIVGELLEAGIRRTPITLKLGSSNLE